MRASATSVWIFINLLCFGMCGYLYLIWSQYWMRIEKQRYLQRPTKNPVTGLNYQFAYVSEKKTFINNSFINNIVNKSRRSAVRALWGSSRYLEVAKTTARPSNNVVVKTMGRPRFPNVHTPNLQFDNEDYVCTDFTTAECAKKTEQFKELILKEFHRVLMGDSNVFKSGLDVHNPYNVQYSGPSSRKEASGLEVLCALRKVGVRTVTAEDEPFRSLGYRIPGEPLQGLRQFNTCAVVTSAGALLDSQLGKFIDSHDMVLRFNNAPTHNYTEDVGSKTTFRILNSQVVSKPEYKFLEDPLYVNKSILIWDPANYSASLHEWYHHPDFPLFPTYKRFVEQHREADVHLLRPEVVWSLWSALQHSTPYRLRRNPPSSGFIGLWFSLHRCERVRMFEYVPSARASGRCHYHSPRKDPGCTLGAWHPLAQEKALAERMRDNSDLDVFQRGFIDVPGFSKIKC